MSASSVAPQRKVGRTARPARGTPLADIQTKLEVGPAGDRFEREADQVAAQVMRGEAAAAIPPSITPLGAQRKRAAPQGGSKAKKTDEEKAGAARGRVQRDGAAGAAGGSADAGVAAAIASMQAGSAGGLDGTTRGFMEGRFGRDFSDVRVHDGARAAAAADALGARAFTVGRDMFFARGQYRPHSHEGRQLVAHELTHTVQQGGARDKVAQRRIQRDDDDERESGSTTSGGGTGAAPTRFAVPALPGAQVDTTDVAGAKGTITIPVLALPAVAGVLKGTAGNEAVTPVAAEGRSVPVIGAPLSFAKPMPRRDPETVPARVWTAAAKTDSTIQNGIKGALTAKIAATPDAVSIEEAGQRVHYLRLPQASIQQVFIGTIDELAQSDAILRPQWSDTGQPLFNRGDRNDAFDADHFLEMQLGGADTGTNMWLLKASYNRSVGSRIDKNIKGDLKTIIDAVKPLIADDSEEPLSPAEAKNSWNITFSRVQAGTNFTSDVPYFWTRSQIAAGRHLDPLRLLDEADMVAAGLRLAPGQQPTAIKLFPSPAGGRMKRLDLGPNGTVRRPSGGELFDGIRFNGGTYHGGQPLDAPESDLMTLDVTVLQTKRVESEEVVERRRGTVVVKRAPRLGIAGYISKESIRQAAGTTRFKSLSPLVFSDLEIAPEGVLAGTGSIGSTKAMLPGLQVPLTLYGDRVGIDFPVPVENLSLGPVSITEAGLALGVGEAGFFIEGYAGFEIRSLGTGMVTAALTDTGPVLSGDFALAMDFLDPASISASYDLATDTFSAQATLGVQQGRLPGVESGTVTVTMTRDTVGVDGSVMLGGPLRGTVVAVTYNETDGLRIGADNIPLPFADLPAVQNATLSVAASKAPGAEAWSFAGRGSATLGVPGATGTLEIDYLDGAVTLHGTGAVERGPASGTLDFTATNRQIDAEGRPVEGPLVDTLNAWGRGTVTVRFGSLLTGTAGIELTPDHRIIISGTIALPPVYEVFPRRDYTRDIFSLSPPEFPIWGVSVGGVGVGVFAFIDARVFFEAFVGPGQIRDAAVTATLDLDRPEEATVHGHGEFHVPAYAGLGLDAGGGLRARLAMAYVQGRVGVTGRLGVEAGAGAIVDFDWSRDAGLSLSTDLHAEATPKFALSATASVTVGVDLLVTELEETWGPWERELGSFGPDMTLGARMPVRWSEAAGLDLSLDDIEVTRPQIDAPELMGDVFERLAG